MTDIIVLIIVVKSEDGVVGHQIAVVEEETIKTDTVGQLEVVGRIPVILCINAQLVELNTSGRILLTVITIGKTDHLRSRATDEVINT